MTYTFATFNTRETYLFARQQWKDEYTKLSQDIRTTKADIKQRMKEGKYAGALQYERIKQRDLANQMLKALEEAKIEAQNQYKDAQNVTILM